MVGNGGTLHEGGRGPSAAPASSYASGRERLAFALDVPDLDEAERFVELLLPYVSVFKVGLELFTRAGPEAVRRIRRAGARCFLDLKLHDIPATMGRAAKAAADEEVDLLTVHASAGPEALAHVAHAVEGSGTRVLAVTLLTSLDSGALAALGWPGAPEDTVRRLARMARASGVQGFVASPHESAMLRRELGREAFLVTPGIRAVASHDADDQRRTASATAAIQHGADLVVVGRPIRDAEDPARVARGIAEQISAAAS